LNFEFLIFNYSIKTPEGRWQGLFAMLNFEFLILNF